MEDVQAAIDAYLAQLEEAYEEGGDEAAALDKKPIRNNRYGR